MPIADGIKESLSQSSWIRKMFEEGIKLKQEFGSDNVFDFSLGNPDLNPPGKFFDILRKLSSSHIPGVHGYMPNAGFPDVRKAIAAKVSREQGIVVSADFVIMTCGAAGGCNALMKTILNPGDEVLVPKPYFVEYNFYVKNHGGVIRPVESSQDFSLNINAIREAIGPKTKAVLINSPNNPTGRVYSKDDLAALASVLNEWHQRGQTIYLISDEPYRDIVYDGAVVPGILNIYPHSIVVNSYSKSLSIPGERIGYAAVNPSCDDADSIMAGLIFSNRILGFVNAPALMQRCVAELTDVVVDIEPYRRRRDVMMGGLQDAGYEFVKPEGAFYLFCKSPLDDDVSFVRHLQKYRILAVPGSGFAGPGYFRLAYCVPEDVIVRSIPKFEEALNTL